MNLAEAVLAIIGFIAIGFLVSAFIVIMCIIFDEGDI